MLGVAKLGALSHDRDAQCLGHMPQELYSREMKNTYLFVTTQTYRACSGSTYIKIGTIQRRLAWPLRKDDTQIREAFQILSFISYQRGRVGDLLTVLAHAHMGNKKKRFEKEVISHSMGQELYLQVSSETCF